MDRHLTSKELLRSFQARVEELHGVTPECAKSTCIRVYDANQADEVIERLQQEREAAEQHVKVLQQNVAAAEPEAKPIGYVAKNDGFICTVFAKPGECYELANGFEWMPVYERPVQPPPAAVTCCGGYVEDGKQWHEPACVNAGAAQQPSPSHAWVTEARELFRQTTFDDGAISMAEWGRRRDALLAIPVPPPRDDSDLLRRIAINGILPDELQAELEARLGQTKVSAP